MPSIKFQDIVPFPTITGTTSIQMAGSGAVPIIATVAGQQYRVTTNLSLSAVTTGAGGLDTGSLSTNQLWYIHFVRNNSTIAMLASLSKTAPTGFTYFRWTGYCFTTNGSSQINSVGTLSTLCTIQKFLSGSGTYTTPTNVTRIEVEMVGGGGGGADNSTTYGGGGGGAGGYIKAIINSPAASYAYSVGAAGAAHGGAGGNTTFGSSLLTCNGGAAGTAANQGGAGGTSTLNSPAIGVAFQGGSGEGSSGVNTTGGGSGATSPFGGTGGGGAQTLTGQAAIANTGSGGGGAGGGNAGGAAGGSGIIIVEEFYA